MKKGKKDDKKSGKKGEKKNKNADKLLEQTKQLSSSYLGFCRQFATAPLQQIVVRLNRAIEDSGKCDQIILSSVHLNSSDISSISEAFLKYDQLALFAVWNSLTPFHIIKLFVRFCILKFKGQFYQSHSSIRIIQLINCHITYESCYILCDVAKYTKSISCIEVDHNPIGNGVLDIISSSCSNESGSVKKLSFRFCDLNYSVTFLPVFSSMKSLTYINLNGNQIGDEGLISISRALSDNRSLEELYLQSNQIKNRRMNEVYPLEIVRSVFGTINTTLKVLDLSLNFIDESGSAAVLDCMKDRKSTSKNKLRIRISERVTNQIFSKVWALSGGDGKSKGKKKKAKKK